MARQATGQLTQYRGKRGVSYYARFRAGAQRHLVTLGHSGDGMTEAQARVELENLLADVRRGIWKPTEAPVVEAPVEEATFHAYASEWLEALKVELAAATYDDYRWALTHHLLPFFRGHRLSEITAREVDRYKTAKLAEGTVSANTVNKTLSRLSQILALAVDHGLIPANPAAGKRRRVKGTRPRRLWVEPEKLMTLLEAAERCTRRNDGTLATSPKGEPVKPRALLDGRGRPLLATLAGAGLRIDEALSLRRRDVNLAKGTLTVERSKTDAGVRVVQIPPSLRDELATYLDQSAFKGPADLVFPTSTGEKDGATNVRQRLFVPAIAEANERLAGLGLEPLGDVRPHGLRRTYASLRTACGDDPVFVSRQLGHEDVRFTLNVYAQSVKRREHMTEAERAEYDRAIEWAQWAETGKNDVEALRVPESVEVAAHRETADEQAVR